ncbi:hypothetical protein [Legionella bononiensis]|uniref:Secreted protein n=1 Tax=Legionella bononiensis TaxID=2793102 RepID=A0ABS1WCT5_9GAMM|nr:hypothetical protein [Legionella bononiensis]MBL7479043.1 hypothetical protein [Legionella bononiensis]MBL7527176.1 hypothetical protein [Legionella bononiensis]MBL7562145.1 hypothetical protein [Legionella bononiensis]
MNDLSSWLIAVFLVLFSLMVSAADIPSEVEGTQDLDQLSCVDEATQNCIDNACLTSDDINCEDNCGKLAQQKCQDANNE